MKLVLIVEDNEKNLKLVRDILRYRGYRTLEARTAEDGIELARTQMPDLVLMDIRLPGMDGMAALQVLRADPQTSGIPIVAVTASVMPEERDRFRARRLRRLHRKADRRACRSRRRSLASSTPREGPNERPRRPADAAGRR